ELARASGALAPLSIALNGRGVFAAWCGDFEGAAAVIAEENAVNDVTGSHVFSVGALFMAGYQGRAEEGSALLSKVAEDATARGQGLLLHNAKWARAILHNGLGQHAQALEAARQAADDVELPNGTGWALAELTEAAARSGDSELASDSARRLAAHTIA